MLERRGEGLRRVELALFRTDGKVHRIEAGTSRPIREASEVRALFVERLAALADPIDPGFGFDLARLSVVTAETYAPQQIALEESHDDADLDRLVDRVSARLGARRVTQLIAQDSHTPELAAVSMPAQSARSDTDRGWDAFRHFRAAAELPPRPLRLLARPEPIEAVASVPDGPPVRFRWRRALHEVAAVEGPERIEGAWWRDDGGAAPENLARDYFRVEDASRPPLLDLPRRALSRHRHAGLVPARAVRVRQAMRYVEFACTSNFSFLRGASHPEELMAQAARLKLDGLGLCDRNSVAGVVRAHVAKRESGLKLAYHPGARLVFSDGTPDILAYPRDRAAWGRLTRLLTLGNRRAKKGDCILCLDDLLAHAEGLELIATDGTARLLAHLREAASRRVRLAAAMLYRGDDRARLARSKEIAREARVPLIAVNDVHFHHPDRRPLADVLTCIREKVTIDRAGRRLAANAERHLKAAGRNGAAVPRLPGGDRRNAAFERCAHLLARRIEIRISRRTGGWLFFAAGSARASHLAGRGQALSRRHRRGDPAKPRP